MTIQVPTLLEACDDADLFPNLTLWPKQREILGQVDSGRYREIVLACGRRSGKSTIAAAIAVHDAVFRDLRSYTRPGERRFVICVAASRDQAQVVLRFCRQFLEDSPLLSEVIENQTADEIHIRQPHTDQLVVIRAVPCSARTGRGLAVSSLILDELAHWQEETTGPATAERVYGSLIPAVGQFREQGRIVAISTPWGRTGLFADLFKRAADHDDRLAIQAPTWDVNPLLDEAFFEAERLKDPMLFRGEWGAEFLTSGAAFLDWDDIQKAVDEDRRELEPDPEALIGPVAAIDPALQKDPFALAIIGRPPEPSRRRHLRLALVRSWKAGSGRDLDLEETLDRVATTMLDYGVTTAFTDQHCAAPIRQSLARRGITAVVRPTTPASKSAMFASLKAKICSGELELYRDTELLDELARIEVRYTPGSANVHIPRAGTSHGDKAVALATAVHEMVRHGGGSGGVRPGAGRQEGITSQFGAELGPLRKTVAWDV